MFYRLQTFIFDLLHQEIVMPKTKNDFTEKSNFSRLHSFVIHRRFVTIVLIGLLIPLIGINSTTQQALAGTIGNLNIAIDGSSTMNLNLSIGTSLTIQTNAGTIISVTLMGSSTMVPYGMLTLPDGSEEEWPLSSTGWHGTNTGQRVFADTGAYRFTCLDLNNTSGEISITFQGKGNEQPTDPDPTPMDHDDTDPQSELYQQGIEEGKRICFENPEQCGISIAASGYSEVDLENARNEGYQDGLTACTPSTSTTSDTLSNTSYNLLTNTLHIPVLDLGSVQSYWMDLEVSDWEPLSFVMKGFGENSN